MKQKTRGKCTHCGVELDTGELAGGGLCYLCQSTHGLNIIDDSRLPEQGFYESLMYREDR